jgi:hypothetical protein
VDWIIYTLNCPRTKAVRYVGWTAKSAGTRLARHIHESIKARRTHKTNWIFSLVTVGLKPIMEIIESGTGDGWAEAERRWIAFFRANGARLTNNTDGGQGTPGRLSARTPEERSAIAKQNQANRTPEARAAFTRAGVEAQRACRTFELRSESFKKWQQAKTPEQRSDAGRRGTITRLANSTHEQRSEWAKKGNASLTPEQRSERSKAIWASHSPEKRAAMEKKRQASMTHEQRSAAAKKWRADKRAQRIQP